MQSPLPCKLIREGNRVVDPEEDVLVWIFDMQSNSVLIQRKNQNLEIRSLDEIKLKSLLVLSSIAPGGMVKQ